MENEIDHREILQVLWRGKYFVLAVTAIFTLTAFLYTMFIIIPDYEYSVLLNLLPYQIKGKEVVELIEQKEITEDRDLLTPFIKVNHFSGNDSVLQITGKYNDPEVCVNMVERTGKAIIEAVSDYRFEQMILEKERKQKLLHYLDEVTAEYLLSRDEQITELLEEDPIYKNYIEKKADCLLQIQLIDFNLLELSEQLNLSDYIWLDGSGRTAQIIPVNKIIYIAVAFLIGLVLSVFALFARHRLITQDKLERCQE